MRQMTGLGRTLRFNRGLAKGRFRRNRVIVALRAEVGFRLKAESG
jgi:hypothetical protein